MFSAESRYFSNILDGILILFECFGEKWNICQIFWVEIWYFPIVLGANRKPFKYFVWYFCVSRMFRVRTRYFFECFLYKIRYFRMFFGNQYFFKVWDKITYFLNVLEPMLDYFRIFFAQIYMILLKCFGYQYGISEIFWIRIRWAWNDFSRDHILFGYLGLQTQSTQKA